MSVTTPIVRFLTCLTLITTASDLVVATNGPLVETLPQKADQRPSPTLAGITPGLASSDSKQRLETSHGWMPGNAVAASNLTSSADHAGGHKVSSRLQQSSGPSLEETIAYINGRSLGLVCSEPDTPIPPAPLHVDRATGMITIYFCFDVDGTLHRRRLNVATVSEITADLNDGLPVVLIKASGMHSSFWQVAQWNLYNGAGHANFFVKDRAALDSTVNAFKHLIALLTTKPPCPPGDPFCKLPETGGIKEESKELRTPPGTTTRTPSLWLVRIEGPGVASVVEATDSLVTIGPLEFFQIPFTSEEPANRMLRAFERAVALCKTPF